MSSPGYLESILRGAGKGASLGFDDEGAAKLLGALPGTNDPEGIPRNYAAGSQEQDNLQSIRGDSAAAAHANPKLFAASSLLGSVPLAVGSAGLGGGTAAANALTGAAIGGLAGGGNADGRDVASDVASSAAMGAIPLGKVAPGVISENLPGVSRAVSNVIAENLPAVQRSFGEAQSVIPKHEPFPRPPSSKSGGSWEMPTVPKVDKTPVRESMIPTAEGYAEAADVVHGDKVLGRAHNPEDVDRYRRLGNKFDRDLLGGAPKAKPEPVVQTTESVAKTARPPRGPKGRGGSTPDITAEFMRVGKAPGKVTGPYKEPIGPETPRQFNEKRSRDSAPLKEVQLEMAGANKKARFPEEAAVSDPAVDAWRKNGSGHRDIREGKDPKTALRLNELASSGAEPDIAYRGVQPMQPNKLLTADEFQEPALSSWTTDPEIARTFAGYGRAPVMLRAKGQKGVPIANHSEQELIMPSSKFKVGQVGLDPEGVYQVRLDHDLGEMPETVSDLTDPRQMNFDEVLNRR